MTRSSRNVTLVLLTTGLAALGFTVWDHGGLAAYSTTGPTTRSTGGTHHSYWWSRWGGGSSSGSHGSSFFGGTSRGGFGSSGHSVGS